MDLSPVQGLVGVYVPDAGHYVAVHEEGLYRLAAACCPLYEVGCRTVAGKGFRTDCGKEIFFFCSAVF